MAAVGLAFIRRELAGVAAPWGDRLLAMYFPSGPAERGREHLFRRAMARVRFQQARRALERHDRSSAEELFTAGLSWGEGISEAMTEGATVALLRGEIERAIHLLEEAVRLRPDNEEAYFTLARIHRARGDLSRAREAEDQYRRLLCRHFGGED